MGAAFGFVNRRKKIDRAPRYILRPGEETIVKFSRSGDHKKVTKTNILNLSDSGMAFAVDGRAIPHLGEVLKVDFLLGERILRYGRVVRLESPSDSHMGHDIIVAIEFLPENNEVQKLGLGLNRSLIPIDRATNALLDANVQQLLLVTGFLFIAMMMGI